MNTYKIITDFCSDLTPEIAEKLDVEIIPMDVIVDDAEPVSGFDIPVSDFYAKLRAKKSAKTSAVNLDTFLTVFEQHLAAGEDILYIGLAAGLSCTYASAKLAASELIEKYPGRKIYLVNSHSGSIGEGLVTMLAAEKKKEGLSVSENYRYLKEIAKRIHSEFTLNDLFFLKRGGRLSTATAVLGSVLSLKPLVTFSDTEKLVVTGKARGRKNAIACLVKSVETLAEDPQNNIIAIGHSDCLEDAINLEMMLRAKWDVKDIIIADIGPAMGAHCGPDTLAVFFVKAEKEEEGSTNGDNDTVETASDEVLETETTEAVETEPAEVQMQKTETAETTSEPIAEEITEEAAKSSACEQ